MKLKKGDNMSVTKFVIQEALHNLYMFTTGVNGINSFMEMIEYLEDNKDKLPPEVKTSYYVVIDEMEAYNVGY